MSFLDFLGAPIKGLVDSVGGIIENLVTTDKEKLEAKQKVLALQAAFEQSVMQADVEWAKTQAEVIKAETQSESWMARNWRPILMLVFTYIILHTYVLAPLFTLKQVEIPPTMWELLKLGMGGYVLGRTAEKTATSVAQMLKK